MIVKWTVLSFVLVALPATAWAEKTSIPCVTKASAPVHQGNASIVEKGRKVTLEATTTEKGKLAGYISDAATGETIGWVDRKALACQ